MSLYVWRQRGTMEVLLLPEYSATVKPRTVIVDGAYGMTYDYKIWKDNVRSPVKVGTSADLRRAKHLAEKDLTSVIDGVCSVA